MYEVDQEDRSMYSCTFFHCFGCVIGTLAICKCRWQRWYLIQEYQPKGGLQTVEKERCTALHGVPTMFIAELNHTEF